MFLLKIIKRLVFDILNNKCQIFIVFIIILLVLFVSHFGEMLNINVAIENDHLNLCDEKIDVVYTWVNGSDEKFRENMKKYLNTNSHSTNDYSDERFDDKYELKFSLRSLEKYAPWVNHVYIVTNGQIPYWLNLDYEKVSVVTHEEIFANLEDLPTFSSPAIESNIHRIPGLSKHFIYFNDDIFLGSPVQLGDWASESRGYLILLAWALPACGPSCPWVYVGDGQCDAACLTPACQNDAGDCDKQDTRIHSHHFNSHHDYDDEEGNFDYEYFEEDNNNIIKREIKHGDIKQNTTSNKVLLGSVQVINNNTNSINNNVSVLDFVNQYNLKFLKHDKLKRKKRLFKTLKKRKKFYKNVFNSTNNFNHSNNENNNEQHLDTYALSLQHTNRVFNVNYGFKVRKVPAHAPILINKDIVENLQRKFEKEIRQTQKNRFRSPEDMQYSFSYYYYLINEQVQVEMERIFDEFDTDKSGTWSDREIRTILTRINDLPLNYEMVENFDNAIINCSKHLTLPEVPVPPYERYIDSKLPTVSKNLVLKCPRIMNMLSKFQVRQKYKYDIMKNAQGQVVMFKMLTSNISDVVGHLDDIRKEPRKFICLNDNMDSKKIEDNELVKAILLDFYISLFPNPSKFELPQEFRNRFSYVKDLEDWKNYHIKLKLFLLFCIIVLFSLCIHNICKRRLLRQIKKIIYF